MDVMANNSDYFIKTAFGLIEKDLSQPETSSLVNAWPAVQPNSIIEARYGLSF